MIWWLCIVILTLCCIAAALLDGWESCEIKEVCVSWITVATFVALVSASYQHGYIQGSVSCEVSVEGDQ